MFWFACLILGLDGTKPPDHTPRITGIWPPGITVGTQQTWTISGTNLDKVEAVIASGTGLTLGPVTLTESGHNLSVVVVAASFARVDYREVRVDGPSGVSNLALVRVDPLTQVEEVEGNDQQPTPRQVIPVGTAVAGTIRPLDVDRFRVEGVPGQRVTLDWETRRLGTAIIPVMTVTGPNQAAIGQARSQPGGDRDCRFTVDVPPAGWFEVELRDNIYAGDDRARYRLRVDPAPFGTGLFPLGSPRSDRLVVTLGGGSLLRPITTTNQLPTLAGSWFDPGPFLAGTEQSGILAAGRLRVGDSDRPRLTRPADLPGDAIWPVDPSATGVTIDGRLDRLGQVDRFRVPARAGDRFRARVEAASAGSWLDSVVTILDSRGQPLGTNDDPVPPTLLVPPDSIDGSLPTDSEVDLTIPADGPITIELADRFGSGGCEYAYALDLGPPRDDFRICLLPTPRSADPGPEARSLVDSPVAGLPGLGGSFNVAPGASIMIPFVVIPRGRPGSIEVWVEGLPPGIESESVTLRLAAPPQNRSQWDALPAEDALHLRVRPDARPVLGSFQVKARTRPRPGPVLERLATRVVGVDAAGGPSRPVIRPLTTLPIRIIAVP